MANYNYQARTINGNLVKGKIDAKDEGEAKIKLRAKQLVPVKVTLVGADDSQKSDLEDILRKAFAPKVASKELKIFTRQFATLINSGIPIADALKILRRADE